MRNPNPPLPGHLKKSRHKSYAEILRQEVPYFQSGLQTSQKTQWQQPLLPCHPKPFPIGRCFRCGDKDYTRECCHNPIKCFLCQQFGHKAILCKLWEKPTRKQEQMQSRMVYSKRTQRPSRKPIPNPSNPSSCIPSAGFATRKAFISEN